MVMYYRFIYFHRFQPDVIHPLHPDFLNRQLARHIRTVDAHQPPPPAGASPFSPAGASPSLVTLLATPLANLGPTKTPPLVLSSALPPVPGKVVEAIRSGTFVDFRDLLTDNVALKQRVVDGGLLSSSSLRLREISDRETWLHCFLAFVAAKVECQETRDLMAYGQIILMLARKHGGLGWRAYDTHFRQLRGAGHSLPWTELNPSMLAANVLQAAGQFCSLCQSHDNRREDCALAPPLLRLIVAPTPTKRMTRSADDLTGQQAATLQSAVSTTNAGRVSLKLQGEARGQQVTPTGHPLRPMGSSCYYS